MSTSQASFFLTRNHGLPPPSSNRKYHDRPMIIEEREGIIYRAIIKCFPNLHQEYINVSPLKGDAQEKLGDYTCTNILTMCEGLRRLDRYFLDQMQSQDIARKVLEAIKKDKENTMITELKLHDAGFLTFRLSWKWMTKKIQEMLTVGIDLWAPVIEENLIVIDGPELFIGADLHAEEIRSRYIREMLICLFDYSGIAVSTGLISKMSSNALRKYFTLKPGVMTSIRHGTPLFAGKSEDLAKKFQVDLQALWSSIYELKVKSIVYVTSVRELEYVKKCFDVAKNEGWLSVEWNPSVTYSGYRTSSVERQKLAHLWTIFENRSDFRKMAFLVQLGKRLGYTPEACMECAIKYTYLKTHRLAECTLDIDEMLDEEGNTFLYLLKIKVMISSLVENSGGRGSIDKYTKAKNSNEHKLAVHLVQFTEVIERSCATFLLHHVCDYLWVLCNKFTSYYSKVSGFMDPRTYLLCDATEVVMNKCFDILWITPDTSRSSSRVASKEEMTGVEVISWPVSVARPKNINPRFEMFTMNVCVAHDSFRKGSIHGIVSLVDTDRLLSDGRLPLNKRENGHVAYLYNEWYESIGICNNGYINFKTPSPSHIVPFSKELEIFVKLFATTEDKCFQMCLFQQPIDLSKLWADKSPSHIRGTLRYDGDNGCTSIDYIALRDAVDTTMKLSLESTSDPHLKTYVCGDILASYGNLLDDLDDLRKVLYKASIFEVSEGCELEVGPISVQKSVMAVPVRGTLVLEARFTDKSGTVLYDGKRIFRAKGQGSNEWRMKLNGDCFLNLEVEWSQGPKSSYC